MSRGAAAGLGGRAGGRAAVPRGPGPARPRRSDPGLAPDQPPPAGGGHPRLLPVRVRRRADRRGRGRAPRPAPPAAAAPRDADGGGGGAPAGGRGRRSRRRPATPDRRRRRGAPRPGAARAAVRGRACASRRRCGLDRERPVAATAAFVRVIGKGDQERVVPVGEVALEWLARYLGLAAAAPGWPRRGEGDGPGTPLFVTQRGHRLGRQAAWSAVKVAAEAAGLGDRVSPAHAAPLLRDAPPRGRRRPARRPGAARTCQYLPRRSCTRT